MTLRVSAGHLHSVSLEANRMLRIGSRGALIALLVVASPALLSCTRVDCEGRVQLDDGRCPCGPGQVPVSDAGSAMVSCVPAGDAGDASVSDCVGMVRYADEDRDGYGDPTLRRSTSWPTPTMLTAWEAKHGPPVRALAKRGDILLRDSRVWHRGR